MKIHLQVLRGRPRSYYAICGAGAGAHSKRDTKMDRHIAVVTCKNCLRCAKVEGYISRS